MVQLLATKLFLPLPRPDRVSRSRLIEQLNDGLRLGHKLTLISAPAGFGKTTLVSEWIAGCERPAAWLSLDEGDNDPARFLTYLVGAVRTVAENLGEGVLGFLQSPQPPPIEAILTSLLNEIAALPDPFLLILDDCHVVDAKPVERALAFLLDHQPSQMHLVLTTRQDPDLPLARVRAGGQLTELRAVDLRFTSGEAAEFLNQVMRLQLSVETIAALESRTEGWVAGLQLAALSMQGQRDTARFVQSFTGSHRFVMDYLLEEVLHRQPETVQTFLLQTSILDRLCAPLCDAVVGTLASPQDADPSVSSDRRLNAPTFKRSNEILEYLEHANLFMIPLDHERRWYRYHHLFADLLRQRLQHSLGITGAADRRLNELHLRASQWFEDNGLQMEAFQHAAAGQDIERAERLIEGKGIPLHLSGAITPILDWLDSLPPSVMNARPSLWWRHASLLLINGQTAGVAEKLQSAEAAVALQLQGAEPDDEKRNLLGKIASARATLALTRYDVETMLTQSRRALEYLHPNHLASRANANWTLGFAYGLQGDRVAARRSFQEAISLSRATGAIFPGILATIGLGNIQELDNQLHEAAETYRRILELVGDHPQQIISEVYLGLARILYEWNDLQAAEQHAQQSLHLARQYERIIDRSLIGEVFLARLRLALGHVDEASAILAKAAQTARQQNFMLRIPEIAAAQVLTLLRQGNLTAAAHLAQTYNLPLHQARVELAQGKTAAALDILESWRQQVETKVWHDERLKTIVLQAIAHRAQGKIEESLQVLAEALALAEPEGFVRLFLDEGQPMAQLLAEAAARQMMPEFVAKLLAAFEAEKPPEQAAPAIDQPLVEPLSPRELEVLRLIAQGLSNEEIGKQLFLALDTVKGHNRRIFDKLHVQRRTEAVARARELRLL